MKFTHVVPADRVSDATLVALRRGPVQPAIAALYLLVGAYAPERAKTHGLLYGFCDAEGTFIGGSRPGATHFGWAADP